MSLDTTFNANQTLAINHMMPQPYGSSSGNLFEMYQPAVVSSSQLPTQAGPTLSPALYDATGLGLYSATGLYATGLSATGLYGEYQLPLPSLQELLGVINLSSNEVGNFSSNGNFASANYVFGSSPSSIFTTGIIDPSIANYTTQNNYWYGSNGYANGSANPSYFIDIPYIAQSLGISPNLLSQINPYQILSLANQQAQFNIASSARNNNFVTFGASNVFPPPFGYAQGNAYPSAYPFPVQGSVSNSPFNGFYS